MFEQRVLFSVNFLSVTSDHRVQCTKVGLGLGSKSRTSFLCFYYTPRKLCLWEGILFSRCPSVRPSDRPNVCP